MAHFNLIASPGILGLRSNRQNVKWSYGVAIPDANPHDMAMCPVVINFEVVSELPPSHQNDNTGKYHYFSGLPGDDCIYYDRSLVINKHLRFRLEGLLQGTPSFTVNHEYYRYITHRFMNLHSAGYILTDIASLLLLRSGYSPLHCSAFKKGNSGVVIFAPPNTGKTLTTMQACMKFGGEFIAEDIAITDGITLHAVPWTSTFRYYAEVDSRPTSRLRNKLTQAFPPIELIPSRHSQSIQGFVDPDRILASAALTHIVILERGPSAIIPVSIDEAFHKIRNLNRYEFHYATAPSSIAYEFFNPSLNLDGASDNEIAILNKMIRHAQEVIIVRSPNPTAYTDMLWSHLP